MVKTMPDFSFERKLWKQGFKAIAGVDEVGRGAWAGPVVAGAVVFSLMGPAARSSRPTSSVRVLSDLAGARRDSLRSRHPSVILGAGINDSKKLKPREREKLAEFIKQNAASWGIGEVGPRIINRLGMAKATRMAFRRAIAECNSRFDGVRIDFLLIDAFFIPYVRGLRRRHQKPIIDGDEKSLSIAAASIIAKVYRDALMRKLSRKYPQYKWGRNKGYGAKAHQEAIKRYGMTRLHRKMFVETWEAKARKRVEQQVSETTRTLL